MTAGVPEQAWAGPPEAFDPGGVAREFREYVQDGRDPRIMFSFLDAVVRAVKHLRSLSPLYELARHKNG